MNTCTSCGSELEPGGKFCPNCGASVTITEPEQSEIPAAVNEPEQAEQPEIPAAVENIEEWAVLDTAVKFNLIERLYNNLSPAQIPLICEKICELARIYGISDVSFKRTHTGIYTMLAWAADEFDKAGNIRQAAQARYQLAFLNFDTEVIKTPDYTVVRKIILELMKTAQQEEEAGYIETAGEIHYYIGNLYLIDDTRGIPEYLTVKEWWDKAVLNNHGIAASRLAALHFSLDGKTAGFNRRETVCYKGCFRITLLLQHGSLSSVAV